MELVEAIAEQLNQQNQVRVAQTTNITSRTWLLTELTHTPSIKKMGILIVAKNNREIKKWQNNLLFWTKNNNQPPEIYHLNEQQLPFLSALINRQPGFYLVEQKTWQQSLPQANDITKNTIKLNKGLKIQPTKLLNLLVKNGYQRQTKVFAAGEFARRGETIDIYATKNPIRLVFHHQTIEELYTFNPFSQKKIKELPATSIIPQIMEVNEPAYLTDYLHNNILLTLPDDWPEINIFKKAKLLLWQKFATSNSITAGFREPTQWKGEIQKLNKHLKEKNDWQILIASDNYRPEDNIKTTRLAPESGVEGFINVKEKIELITDQEILKPTFPYHQKTPTEHLLLDKVKPGDYVVHIDHGIARYAGLNQQIIDGRQREMFELHYADGDKLFVPVDRADRLSKYIGLTRPKLHRLSSTHWESVRQRIKKDLFANAQKLLNIYARRELARIEPLEINKNTLEKISQDFAFAETPDQQQAWEEIKADLQKKTPMDRLICGDVGFGKTEIALRTAALLALNCKQVAVLCPTTILAQQHFDTFSERLNKYGLTVASLSRLNTPSTRRQTIAKIASGKINIIIGTHRLLSADIKFKNLGLLIIDEEQRFGVKDKERLKKIRPNIHILTMTATPIPRTLNFSLSGLKPISLIMTPPAGRQAINTFIAKYDKEKIKNVLSRELNRKGQAYYLYNQVETIELKVKKLKRMLPKAHFGIAHGKLPSSQLAQVMHDFDTGKIDILVCSTIIENGLDLPNANTLIVEQAPRFGLAQLYQLRGRIGRSDRTAFAYFFYGSEKLSGQAQKRLQTLEAATELGDGFKIARRDLEIRGIGNILGKEQHGEIKAIGLNLYLQLLGQAVEEIKTGQRQQTPKKILLDLPLTYTIPDSLVPEQEKKFRLYQQLSLLNSEKKLEQFVQKKFPQQKLPTEFTNLIYVLKIKLLCQKADIETIDTVNNRKIIIYLRHPLTDKKIYQLLQFNPHWLVKNNKLKIDLADLGPDWPANLKKSLVFIKK